MATALACSRARRAASAALLALAAACGGGGRSAPPSSTEISISGTLATDGVFDPAPASDGAGGLWMSYSAVRPSPHATSSLELAQVRTRLASSPDAGATWSDLGVDPNGLGDADLQVPDGKGGTLWATWRFEVSRLIHDPYDSDAGQRWKLPWHRLIAVAGPAGTQGVAHLETGWLGLATAPAPAGPWSAERKLFTGLGYDPTMDAFLGAPELPLASLYPGAAALGGCAFFSEPGLLARPEGVYVSLVCFGAADKVVLLRCNHDFASCAYLGDLLQDGEAAAFSRPGEALQGFSASELVEAAGAVVYLLVTPWVIPPQSYRGCLVFRVSDLSTAAVERSGGNPVLVKEVSGASGTFNGACGYDSGATGSGILYGQYQNAAPHFHLFASHVGLP